MTILQQGDKEMCIWQSESHSRPLSIYGCTNIEYPLAWFYFLNQGDWNQRKTWEEYGETHETPKQALVVRREVYCQSKR